MTMPNDNPILQVALKYAAMGWKVIPLHTTVNGGGCSCRKPGCISIAKHPKTLHGLKDATVDEAIIRKWWRRWPDANVGVATGSVSGLVVMDIDPRHGGDETLAKLQEDGDWPETLAARTGGGGWHFLFQHPGGHVNNGAGKLGPGLDVRGDGGYIVAPPSLHASGRCYEWEPLCSPDDLEPAALPDWLAQKLRESSARQSVNSSDNGARDTIPDGQRNETLFKVGCSLRAKGLSEAAILAALLEENRQRCEPPLAEEEVRRIAASTTRYESAITVPGPELTEGWNTKLFVLEYGSDFRYVAGWNDWHSWDGRRWERDATGRVFERAKQTILKLYAQVATTEDDAQRKKLLNHVRRSDSFRSYRGMISLAQSDPAVIVEPFQLDVDPWLLNVLNGTLDLRTGILREHCRDSLLTKLIDVEYHADAEAPIWSSFLDRITEKNEALKAYLQRIVGYALTGDTSEQCLFLLYGTGANGKSTFVETIRRLLCDYARQSDFSAFLAKRTDGIKNDIARLVGARFVSAVEAGDGRRFAESLVKQVTGGDKVSARFLFKEFFEFTPNFKLFLATNHKPIIRGTDRAIWRRIRLIPFTVTIPPEEQDRKLSDKLSQELPGILSWAVAGCRSWIENGLGEPESVLSATESYKKEMDVIGAFIEDRCVVDEAARVKASEVYEAYKTWCTANGESVQSRRMFGGELSNRDFERKREASGYWYLGLGLRVESE